MPPRNKPRNVYAEQHLAQRIAQEREARGWTYDGLAARMAAIGCPIDQSAIYKIERGYKVDGEKKATRRRITVDELIGFSMAFSIGVEEMVADPALVRSESLRAALMDYRTWMRDRVAAVTELDHRETTIRERIRELVSQEPSEARAFVRDYLADIFPSGSHWVDDMTEYLLDDAIKEA